jgi:hypothetical protein
VSTVHDINDQSPRGAPPPPPPHPDDTVLLAPAVASMDMFRDYRHRGEVFVAAVHALEELS